MYPQFFGLSTYGLLVVTGLVAGLVLLALRSRHGDVRPGVLAALGIIGLFVGAFGARTLHLLFVPDDYTPWYAAFFSIRGGFALNGGILSIMATVGIICRIRGLDFLAVADRLTPSAPLAIFFFRLGCFCNGCCVGQPTELPWGIRLSAGSPTALRSAGVALHPTQLYAAASAASLLLVLWVLERRRVPTGTIYGTFMLVYGALRMLYDTTRWGDPSGAMRWVLPANQVLNLALAVAGAVVLIRLSRSAADRDLAAP